MVALDLDLELEQLKQPIAVVAFFVVKETVFVFVFGEDGES